MKKPKLSDYNITETQYSEYRKYQNKCEVREGRIEKIEDNFFYVVALIVYFIVVFLFAKGYTEDFTKIPTPIKNASETINLIVMIIGVVFIPVILFFTGGFILVGILWGIFSLLKIPKLFQFIYSKLYKQPNKQFYFSKIDEFVKKEQEYNQYIQALEKQYPDIELPKYNYNVRLYLNDVFNSIVNSETKHINKVIQERNEKKQIDYWLNLDGFKFEKEVSDIYRKLGYKVETTRAVADGGVDIKLWDNNNEYIIVQCKNHKNKVGPSIVRDLCGTMLKERAKKAILLCSGGFNQGVFDFAKGMPIDLMDINQFLQLVDKVYPKTTYNSQITNSYCINPNFTCRYKIIEGEYIPFSQYEQTMLKDQTIYFLKLIDNEFCVFENEEKAQELINRIKNQTNKPINDECFYEIAEYTVKSVIFYYVRIYRKQHKYFEIKKTQYKSTTKTYYKKKGYYRRWY